MEIRWQDEHILDISYLWKGLDQQGITQPALNPIQFPAKKNRRQKEKNKKKTKTKSKK